MNLILWRHAEAEDGGYALPDAERKLTQKGRGQADRMAKWLNSRMPEKPHIVVSPSVRTRQTADAFGRAYDLEDRLYDSSVDDYLAVIHAHDAHETLMLVGHQPLLGELASLLLCGDTRPWASEIEKGSIWWLKLNKKRQAAIALVAVVRPELL